jgi:hypothetical protein
MYCRKCMQPEQTQAEVWRHTCNMSTQRLSRLMLRVLQGGSIQCMSTGTLSSGLGSALHCASSGGQSWQPSRINRSFQEVTTQLTSNRTFASSATEQGAKTQHQLQEPAATPDTAEGSRCKLSSAGQSLAKVGWCVWVLLHQCTVTHCRGFPLQCMMP